MQRLEPGFMLAAGRYELRSKVGAGGMGEVWAANDTLLARIVALKIMHSRAEDEVFAARFREEARHTAGLSHLNIATLFDYGEEGGLAYIVMELVRGVTLQQLLAHEGAQPPSRVRSVVGQAALALSVAHAAGIVHRDVKPGNIMVTKDGTVKLTDFGIARSQDSSGLTQHGELLGTPYYVSPEQALGHTATAASDLYALGVVAHELLTGQRPFDKPTPVATALAQVQEDPPALPDDLPEDLRAVVEQCLAKDIADRPESAIAVAEALGVSAAEMMWPPDAPEYELPISELIHAAFDTPRPARTPRPSSPAPRRGFHADNDSDGQSPGRHAAAEHPVGLEEAAWPEAVTPYLSHTLTGAPAVDSDRDEAELAPQTLAPHNKLAVEVAARADLPVGSPEPVSRPEPDTTSDAVGQSAPTPSATVDSTSTPLTPQPRQSGHVPAWWLVVAVVAAVLITLGIEHFLL